MHESKLYENGKFEVHDLLAESTLLESSSKHIFPNSRLWVVSRPQKAPHNSAAMLEQFLIFTLYAAMNLLLWSLTIPP